jgi:hypothetical protein
MNDNALIALIKAGALTKEQAMALTSRNLSKPGQMSVEPDTPVKPDKIKVPESVKTTVTMVELKVGADVVQHYLTFSSMTEDERGLYFHLAKRYHKRIFQYRTFWVESEPDIEGPVSFYHPYIISHMPVVLNVSNGEDVDDYVTQSKAADRAYLGRF